jgi:hypothetical protein
LIVVLADGVEGVGGGAFSYYGGSIVISDGLISIEAYAFASHSMVTVYTNLTDWPAGWDEDWHEGAMIVWGCELSADGTYLVSFVVGNIIPPWEDDWRDYEFAGPRRAGFVFGGWALTAQDATNQIAAYTTETLWQAADGTELYAIWE